MVAVLSWFKPGSGSISSTCCGTHLAGADPHCADLTAWPSSSQAQRDFFGSHTYQRTDKDGWFHTVSTS
jgi:hypothetical protein